MPAPSVVILSSGGMRSLVATALAVQAHETNKIALLHIKDGRACAAVRLEHARRQAQHYKIRKLIELDLPHLRSVPTTSAQAEKEHALLRPQMLLVGVAYAIDLGAGEVVWPCQFNADYRIAARVTEQVTLIEQLAELDHAALPTIRTPLVELSDRQLVELGGHQSVPWELSWSCQLCGGKPCKACPTCKRRHAAFESAGVVDPVDALVART